MRLHFCIYIALHAIALELIIFCCVIAFIHVILVSYLRNHACLYVFCLFCAFLAHQHQLQSCGSLFISPNTIKSVKILDQRQSSLRLCTDLIYCFHIKTDIILTHVYYDIRMPMTIFINCNTGNDNFRLVNNRISLLVSSQFQLFFDRKLACY